jgi:serine/threonine protein kinase
VRRLDLLTSDDLPVSLGQLTLCVLRGQGSTGRVFRAETRGVGGLPRVVAVTVLRPADDRVGGDPWGSSLPEVHRARLLRHRGVVQTFSCGERDGLPFAVTELVDGVGLAELVSRAGPLPPRNALDICIQVAAGLGAAHRLSQEGQVYPLFHGDLRPSRVMVGVDGVVKVRGFGFRELVGGEAGPLAGAAFAAPEVLEGAAPDAASDVFSVGALLAYCLLGKAPFPASVGAEPAERIAALHEVTRAGSVVRAAEAVVAGLGHAVDRMITLAPGARCSGVTEAEASMRELRGGLRRGEGLARLVQRHFGMDLGSATLPGAPPKPLLAAGTRRPPARPAPPRPPPRSPGSALESLELDDDDDAPRLSQALSAAPTAQAPAHRPAPPPPPTPLASVNRPPPAAAPSDPARVGRPAPPPVPAPRREIVAAPPRAAAPPDEVPTVQHKAGARPGMPDETPTDPGRPERDLESLDVIPVAGTPGAVGRVELEPTRPPQAPPERSGPTPIGPPGRPAPPPRPAPPVAAPPRPIPPPVAPAPPPVAPAPPPVKPAPPPVQPAPPRAAPRPAPPVAAPGPDPSAAWPPPMSDQELGIEPEDGEEASGGLTRLLVRALAFLVIVLGLAFIGLQFALRSGLIGDDVEPVDEIADAWETGEPDGHADLAPDLPVDGPELEPPTRTSRGEAGPQPDPIEEPTPLPERPVELEERPTPAPTPARTFEERTPERVRPEPTAERSTPRPTPTPARSDLPAGSVSLSVSHRPLTSGASGASDLVSVRIDGPSDTTVTLHSGPAGGPYKTSSLKGKSGGRWEGWLTFSVSAGERLEYWITASHPGADGPAGAGSRSSPFVVEVQ